MKRWVRNTALVTGLLLVAGGAAYYWYLGDGDPPAAPPAKTFDLAAMRAKADELPGGKALEIRVEKLADFAFPAVASVGGDGWNILPMGAYAYEIVLPADNVIIDAGITEEMAGSLGASIDTGAVARLRSSMDSATQIVLTHEHGDHVGGIVEQDDPELIRKALRLNRQQVDGLDRYGLALPAALTDYVPLDYEGMIAIAPGVVLVRAPGHTPGSQLIYVQREDGREILFIGDIAWTMRNIETGKGRPRLMSDLMLGEDRDEVFRQLSALGLLARSNPDLRIVPGHDSAALDALIASGIMTAGFTQ